MSSNSSPSQRAEAQPNLQGYAEAFLWPWLGAELAAHANYSHGRLQAPLGLCLTVPNSFGETRFVANLSKAFKIRLGTLTTHGRALSSTARVEYDCVQPSTKRIHFYQHGIE